MSGDKILIIGSPTCFVSGLLLRELKRRKHPVWFMDLQDFERLGINVSWYADADKDELLIDDAFEEMGISSNDIKSVFFRESVPRVSHRMNDPHLFRRIHAPDAQSHHWEQLLKFIASALTYIGRRCFCLYTRNEPLHAVSKVLQLSLARELGFRVPDTYIGTDIEDMRQFTNSQKQVISKPFFPRNIFFNGHSYQTHTSLFTIEDLDEISETQYPVILQEAFVDRTDIRVGVVGRKIFASEIITHGTEHDSEIIDFRYFESIQQYGVPAHAEYRNHVLPPDIEDKCMRFIRDMELQYGMIDLLLLPDGQYIFLENNPKGMHGEVDAGGHNIIGAITDLLIDPESNMN